MCLKKICCIDLKVVCLFVGSIGWILTIFYIFQLTSPDFYGYILISVLICSMLIWGTHKKDKRFIFPWLVLKSFEIFLMITIVSYFIACISCENKENMKIAWILLIATVVESYFWLCVLSYYLQIVEYEDNMIVQVHHILIENNNSIEENK